MSVAFHGHVIYNQRVTSAPGTLAPIVLTVSAKYNSVFTITVRHGVLLSICREHSINVGGSMQATKDNHMKGFLCSYFQQIYEGQLDKNVYTSLLQNSIVSLTKQY